ncbi:unnamed protein product [Bursaphelenchus xylophilus]|uniref:(pine wood nematode) hypothetical protein n=1 Tax=Bursaphelenchus xylophilus TaxID=6326 RepID=A0A1I7S1K8_BURXY|nr:unnamed protein product [Bursaphelenchus xylophilus]CAG9081327.1 unnamed protein product [Bursaphelenchus xylophilus]
MRAEASSSTRDECAVCSSGDATIHFGVSVCRSCAAFFRRTIVLKRNYVCLNGKNCNIKGEARACCAACRLKKCFKVGMEREKIRQHFDKNGPRKRKLESLLPTDIPPPKTALSKMAEGYRKFLDDIKVLYFAFHPAQMFDEKIVFEKVTLQEHCDFDRTSVAYYLRMLNECFHPFNELNGQQKKNVLEMFHFQIALLNMHYLNTIYFPNDDSKQLMHLGAYSDATDVDHFFSQHPNGVQSFFRTFTDVVVKFRRIAKKFRAVRPDETEIAGLIGITLWREVSNQFPSKTHDVQVDKIQEELTEYCQQKNSLDRFRIGRLLCLLRGIDELASMLTEGLTVSTIAHDVPQPTTDIFKQ